MSRRTYNLSSRTRRRPLGQTSRAVNDLLHRSGRERHSGGFTLLEVLLTLSMSVVLMALVGATLQFYATNMNVKDSDVRRVHLATSVLQMISDDMRASLYGSTFDASTLESFLSSAVTNQAAAAATAVDPAAAEVLGLGATEPTMTAPTLDSTTDLTTSTLTLTKPGLIGTQTQIQFDISRLPRLDNWTPTISATPGVLADVPSDVKTVTYYVQPPGSATAVVDPLQGFLPSELPSGVSSGGLVRRELDRAANNWAMESGGLSGLMMTGELVAAEVTAISFEYFDGVTWQILWNSDEMEAMPKAIRITLTVADESIVSDGGLSADVVAGTRTFTHVVRLPVGATATTSTTETTDAAGDTSASGAAGTTSSSSTSTTGAL